ncbi:hypothetical protein SCALM49S_04771 [Streptomyces californicus]
MPHLAEQLLHVLAHLQLDGELPQFVEVLQQDGVRYVDDVRGDADRVAVQVDEAEAPVGVDVAQESGDSAVRSGDHHVPQGRLPRRIGPDPGEHGGGNGQRTHHPLLDVAQAAALVPVQPLGQLAETDDRRVLLHFARNGLPPPALPVAADHFARLQGGWASPAEVPTIAVLPVVPDGRRAERRAEDPVDGDAP